MFKADKFEQIISPTPPIIVMLSIFSLKKIRPKIVVKINFEKSKDIRFVSLDKLNAFVQQNFQVLQSLRLKLIISTPYDLQV